MNVATHEKEKVINSSFLQDVLAGLKANKKSLNPKWLYDETGSALFEEITSLPEYYLTRTETTLLRDHAQTLVHLVPKGGLMVELGSGASVKTRLLLDAGDHMAAYMPVDISAEFLHQTAAGLQIRYPDLSIEPLVGDFCQPLAFPPHLRTVAKVGFFPGSTIGNIPPSLACTLLSNAKEWPGVAAFILGVDLVKDEQTLVNAYDDSAGVTARFISNILPRLNREAGANFDLDQFSYQACWNPEDARIEMSLISSCKQDVTVGNQAVHFDENETISISFSRKYTLESLQRLSEEAGWSISRTITDANEQFAVVILRPAA